MKTYFKLSILTLSALALTLSACGRDRTGPVGPIGPTGGSTLITAAGGGTVTVADTETQLAVPAGAFATDTEVVLSVESPAGYPAEEGLREVIAMSPAGTVLEAPATLNWQPSGVPLTGSEALTLLRFVDDVWIPVDASVTVGSGGIASTQITTLQTYGLRVSTPPVGSVGNISGNVLHIYTEEPLAGIALRLVGPSEVTVDSTVSGSDGSFSFSEIPVGSYSLIADVTPENNCFGDPTEQTVEVTEGGDTSVFFGFVPGPC